MTQYIFDTATLRAHGFTSRAIAQSVAEGRLVKLRRGKYARPDAPPELMAAARAGGRLSCVSALAYHGAWTLEHSLHVRIARGVAAGRGAHIHWTDERGFGDVDDPETALGIALSCLTFREAVVVVDSVGNRGVLPWATVEAICRRTPRGRRVLAAADPKSDSGLETLARLALRSRRVRLRSQVQIPGVGRVDLLIGDRLVLELDGESFHADFDRDRARDRALIVAGYLVIRVSYRQLMDDWSSVEAQLLELVRRGEHIRRPLGA